MPHPITIPRLGWSMEEGVFAEWLKAPGELVRAGDMLFLLEGEKAAHEIESFDSGVLCVPSDAPQPGTTVKVGEVIGYLLAEGEPAPRTVGLAPVAADPPAKAQPVAPILAPTRVEVPNTPRAAGPAARRLARGLGIDLNAVFTPDPTGRVLCEDIQRAASGRSHLPAAQPIATPRARRRARELGVDWTLLAGTGRDGRIRERDVLAKSSSSAAARAAASEEISPTETGRHVPASKLRRIIAQRMSAGVHQAAPVTLTTKLNAEALVAFRDRLKAESPSGGMPSYNDILLFEVARTLRELPDLNACWFRDGIHQYDAIHVATAVDTPNGLLAPVVRDADQLTLSEIADRTRQLIAAARDSQLSQNQLSGTFTISSLGMFGVDSFTPILNLPQAGILGVGRIVEEPVVRDGQLAVGKTMTLSLSFDHRVVDGAPAARWLQRLCERLQRVDPTDR